MTVNTTPPTTPFSMESMRRDIAAILHEDPDEIANDDNLIELGLDSMRLMTLSSRWSDAGAYIEFSELASVATLEHWWALAQRALETNAASKK